MRHALALVTALAALAAAGCGEKPIVIDESVPAPTAPPPHEGPAGEVAPQTRTPEAALPEGVDAKWEPFYAHIRWVFGGDAGVRAAAAAGKPMLLFYAASWCGDSKQMAREALSDADVVAAITKDFVPVLVDVDTDAEWVQRHGIAMTPMLQWTDAEGEVYATTEDVQPKARVLEDLATALEFLHQE